jgi:hypothetical protein
MMIHIVLVYYCVCSILFTCDCPYTCLIWLDSPCLSCGTKGLASASMIQDTHRLTTVKVHWIGPLTSLVCPRPRGTSTKQLTGSQCVQDARLSTNQLLSSSVSKQFFHFANRRCHVAKQRCQ